MNNKKTYLTLFIIFFTLFFSKGQTYTWQAVGDITNTDNQRFDDIFFLNDNLGWAVNGYHAAVYKTTDGGLNWTEQLNETDLGIDLYFRNIEFLNENIGFVSSLNGKIYKTTDGGTNWSEVTNISPNPPAICGFNAIGSSTIYGCGAYFEPAYIIKSTDSGVNWQYIDMSAYATALVEIKFISETEGYAAGKNALGALIIKTTDGGTSWTEIFNSGIAGEYVWKLQTLDSNEDVIFGSVESVTPNLGQLIKSTNAGVSWTSFDAPETFTQAVGFISETHGWMGGQTTGFYETIDGGQTWTDLSIGSNLNRIFVINSTLVYASGTAIYKYTNHTLSTQNFEEHPRELLNVKLLKNPVKSVLRFTIKYESEDNILIELYDINGKFIKQLSRESIFESQIVKEYQYDVSNLSSGVYIINFHNNTGRQSLKFIKE